MSFPAPQNPMLPGSGMQQFKTPEAGIRTMQIIVGALLSGVLMFAGVAAFMGFSTQDIPEDLPAADFVQHMPLVAYLAVGFAAMAIVAHFIVPMALTQQTVAQALESRPGEEVTPLDLYPAYSVLMIIRCAIVEGAAFFNLVSFILDKQIWTWGVVALLMALIAIRFPTRDAVDSWADEQIRNWQLTH